MSQDRSLTFRGCTFARRQEARPAVCHLAVAAGHLATLVLAAALLARNVSAVVAVGSPPSNASLRPTHWTMQAWHGQQCQSAVQLIYTSSPSAIGAGWTVRSTPLRADLPLLLTAEARDQGRASFPGIGGTRCTGSRFAATLSSLSATAPPDIRRAAQVAAM